MVLAPFALADINLFNNGVWIVQGATDPANNASPIAVSVGGVPVGTFSELKISHVFTGAGFPQFFSVTGRGAFQVVVPPPGVAGGTFYLTGYSDCAEGLVPALRITELAFPATAGSSLTVKGKATNLTSLETTNLKLRFREPDNDLVRVEVSYTIYATRDFCVDQTRQAEAAGFSVARIASNYLSAQLHDSDVLNYFAVLEKYCDWYGCTKYVGSVCAGLHNENYSLVCFADHLADPHLVLAHTDTTPRNTPTLAIHFRDPSPQNLNPQGVITTTADPDAENVQVWGNWANVKPSYLAGKKVGNFRFYLEAFWPGPVWCDVGACY